MDWEVGAGSNICGIRQWYKIKAVSCYIWCALKLRAGAPYLHYWHAFLSRNILFALCMLMMLCWVWMLRSVDVVHCKKNITGLCDWSIQWGMSLNPLKCLHIELGKTVRSFTFIMNSLAIPQADSLKYLGVLIQSNSKWHSHIFSIACKANKTLGIVRRTRSNNASPKTKLIRLNAIARPVLEYTCQVWSPHPEFLNKKIKAV